MNFGFAKSMEKDPFRLFFPLGAALALTGILPWVVQYFTHASYPRDLHRVLMIDGFCLSFVCGFLMTAIPRFTGSYHANRFEIVSIFFFIVASSVGAFLPSQGISFFSSAIVLAILMLFAVRRFLNMTSSPPYTFVFIGVGLILWFASNVFLFLSSMGLNLNQGLVAISQDLFSNGAIMSLVLGVGGRLVPAILGWQEVLQQRVQGEPQVPFLRRVPFAIWIAVMVFVLSYLLEPMLPPLLCLSARFLVVLYFALKYWIILKLPATRSLLAWNLWISCWCLVLGYLCSAVWPGLGVHVMHVLFIGGFSLLILLVSTRVSLAHSPVGTGVERTSRRIVIFSCLILLAMLTRVTAILLPSTYLDHLGFAAIIWVAALVVWASLVFKTMQASRSK